MLATALEGGAGEHATEPFSLTIGVSAFPRPAAERQQLVHQADAALYWGKRHGRTDVQLFDPSRHGIAEDSRPLDEIAAAVSRVAAERLLTPGLPADLQPAHGRGPWLRRARPPAARGRLPEPGRDVRRGRVDGRTVELDLASLETVIAGASALDERLYLSVNLSPRSLETDAFNPFELLELCRRHGIAPEPDRGGAHGARGGRGHGPPPRHPRGPAPPRDAHGGRRRRGRQRRAAAPDRGRLRHHEDRPVARPGGCRDAAPRTRSSVRCKDLAGRRRQSIVAEGVETVEQLELVDRPRVRRRPGLPAGPPEAADRRRRRSTSPPCCRGSGCTARIPGNRRLHDAPSPSPAT